MLADGVLFSHCGMGMRLIDCANSNAKPHPYLALVWTVIIKNRAIKMFFSTIQLRCGENKTAKIINRRYFTRTTAKTQTVDDAILMRPVGKCLHCKHGHDD